MLNYKSLVSFLCTQCLPNSKLLLALSGGPDSIYLLHALLRCREEFPFELGIAHVDHGWRDVSGDEALQLKLLADSYAIPFYLKKLNPNTLKGNLEAACREERYRFFKEVCLSQSYFGVFVGHHFDDKVETVTKRLFEGAHWSHFNGLKPKTILDGLLIFRPLLKVKKKDILSYLDKKKISYFIDCTNVDEKFNRARIRHTLLPQLSKSFGKNIDENISILSGEMEELSLYFESRLRLDMQKWIREASGYAFELDKNHCFHLVELKWMIRKKIEELGLFLSREIIHAAAKGWLSLSKHLIFQTRSTKVTVQRQRLLIVYEGHNFENNS